MAPTCAAGVYQRSDVLETTLGHAGEVEIAAHRLLETAFPVIRIDEVAVDAVFDCETEAVRRGCERRGLDDRRLEILQLRFASC